MVAVVSPDEGRRIAVRIFIDGSKRYEWPEVASDSFQEEYSRFLVEHAAELERPNMIEIEFLDEGNSLHRFARFGTDPSMMTLPAPVCDWPGL